MPVEIVLGGTDEIFDVPAAPGTWVDISDFASSKLGMGPAVSANVVAQNRSNGARIRLFYNWQGMRQIVDAAGQTLTFSLSSGRASARGITNDERAVTEA